MAVFEPQRAPGGGGKVITLGEKDNHVREIVGVFLGSHMGGYGKPLYDFEVEGGEQVSVSHNHQLEAFLTPERVGQLMQIMFTEMSRTKSAHTVKNFKFTVARPDSLGAEDFRRFPSLQKGNSSGIYEEPDEAADDNGAGSAADDEELPL